MSLSQWTDDITAEEAVIRSKENKEVNREYVLGVSTPRINEAIKRACNEGKFSTKLLLNIPFVAYHAREVLEVFKNRGFVVDFETPVSTHPEHLTVYINWS